MSQTQACLHFEKEDDMPPRIQVTEEQIIQGAIGIIRKDGINALNARSLAKVLGCSVQPIFRAFANMGELRERVTAMIAEEYQQCLLKGMSAEDPLAGLLLEYIRYAQREKHFFILLHLSDRLGMQEAKEIAQFGINKRIVDAMAEKTGLPKEDAQTLYVGTFFAAHGVASMLATNHCSFTEETILKIITDIYDGLVFKLKNCGGKPDAPLFDSELLT